jgi:peroxiredoxin
MIASETKELVNDAIKNAKNPALAMMILGYYQSAANNPGFKLIPIDIMDVSKIVNDLAEKFPSHQGLAGIKQAVDGEIKKLSGWIGQSAPEISLPDPKGKEIKLSSFRGKYVLVDFWASWCRPCRDDNPNVVKAFNKYKDKNFTIFGVSFDKPGEKDKWLQAIQDDNLTWTHVSDLMHWGSPVVRQYAIESIPFNLLVGPDGKIIGQDLHGGDLEAKLAEVLK